MKELAEVGELRLAVLDAVTEERCAGNCLVFEEVSEEFAFRPVRQPGAAVVYPVAELPADFFSLEAEGAFPFGQKRSPVH